MGGVKYFFPPACTDSKTVHHESFPYEKPKETFHAMLAIRYPATGKEVAYGTCNLPTFSSEDSKQCPRKWSNTQYNISIKQA